MSKTTDRQIRFENFYYGMICPHTPLSSCCPYPPNVWSSMESTYVYKTVIDTWKRVENGADGGSMQVAGREGGSVTLFIPCTKKVRFKRIRREWGIGRMREWREVRTPNIPTTCIVLHSAGTLDSKYCTYILVCTTRLLWKSVQISALWKAKIQNIVFKVVKMRKRLFENMPVMVQGKSKRKL